MKSKNVKLKAGGSELYIGDSLLKEIPAVLSKHVSSFDYVFVLTDSGAKKYVIPFLKKAFPQLKEKNIIVIKSGEHNKQLSTCEMVWDKLTKLGADRYSLLINIGGGAVCDLGGFVASTYMRGIKYVNIPTTLLAMVDASVGGKVGVDFKGLKNHIGAFSIPKAVFICPEFLSTLNKRLILCGYAEMLKHALIVDEKYWRELRDADINDKKIWLNLIRHSVEIKRKITEKDPEEKNVRRLLNFGHTAGHALEAYCIKKRNNSIMHGEAVSWGMVVESYLSFKYYKLPLGQLAEIVAVIKRFNNLKVPKVDPKILIELMRSDKKNKLNKINFTLLNKIGGASIDNHCENNDIIAAIQYANEQF